MKEGDCQVTNEYLLLQVVCGVEHGIALLGHAIFLLLTRFKSSVCEIEKEI